MIVYNTENELFPREEVAQLFNQVKNNFQGYSLEELIKNSKGHFWAFIDNELIGCIYLDGYKDNSFFLSGFSKRKKHLANILAIKKICELYFQTYKLKIIYSQTKFRPARLDLLKAGFKHYKDDIYILENLALKN